MFNRNILMYSFIAMIILGATLGVGSLSASSFEDLHLSRQISDPSVQWTQFGPGSSGYNEGTWFHPTDPNWVYITPDMYPSYYSNNAGRSWYSMLDHDGSDTRAERFDRVYDIDFSRQDENFGVAVNRLGFWFTYDKGRSWIAHTLNADSWSSSIWGGPLSAVAIDPSNDNNIYVGSGQFWNVKGNPRTFRNPHGEGSSNPGKIWRSQDAGQSWTLINSGIDSKAEIGVLKVDPSATNIVYAGTSYGFYKSTDYGDSWELKLAGLENGLIRDLDMYHDQGLDTPILYVIDQVFWEYDSHGDIISKGGVFRSTDRGETWENITSDDLRINLRTLNDWHINHRLFGRLSLSGWFGESEAELRSKINIPTDILPSFNRISVDPRDSNRIYVTHQSRHGVSIPLDAVWATEDGGESWWIVTRIGSGWAKDAEYWERKYVPDDVDITQQNMTFGHIQHSRFDGTSGHGSHGRAYPVIHGVRSLTVSPIGDVLIGFNQQLLVSRDDGRSWKQVDMVETVPGSNSWVGTGNSNLPGRFIHQDPRIADRPYFTTNEHGLWRLALDGDKVWPGAVAAEFITEEFSSPSTLAIHPQDVNTVYSIPFRLAYRGQFRISRDGGYNWETISTPLNIDQWVQVHSLIIDPEKPDNIYFTVPGKSLRNSPHVLGTVRTGVYRSQDEGRTWNIANEGLPEHSSVNRLIFDPTNSKHLYAAVLASGGISGGLYVSKNHADTWSEISLPPGIQQVNDVHIDSVGDIYVAVGREDRSFTESDGVWMSKDRGQSWQHIFHMPYVINVTTAAYDSNRIMVSARPHDGVKRLNPGIYLSLNGGESWRKINSGLVLPEKVFDIAFDLTQTDVLWATARGTGFFKGRLTDELETVYMEKLYPEEFDVIEPGIRGEVKAQEVAFSWQESFGAKQYRLVVARDAAMQDIVVTEVVSDTSVILNDLYSGQKYYWQVAALPELPWYSGETSIYSDVLVERRNQEGVRTFSTVTAIQMPNAPDFYEAENILGEEIHLAWSQVPAANQYTVYRKQSGAEKFVPLATGLGRTVTSYVDYDIELGENYTYKLQSFNEQGGSVYSQALTVKLEALSPDFVELFSDGELAHDWRVLGALSMLHEDGKDIANLRAVFPRATGSLQLAELFSESYRFETRLRVNEYGNTQFAVLRISTSQLGRDSYQLVYTHKDRRLDLQRRKDGSTTSVNSFRFEFIPGEWYDLRLDNRNGVFEVYIDGIKQASWSDSETIPSGGLEIFASNVDFSMEYIQISK